MSLAYFDTSAIIKLSALERESFALVEYLETVDRNISTSVIAEVEVTRTLRRMLFTDSETREAMRGFYLVGFDADVRRTACAIESSTLRSLDAIHLASAMAVDDAELEFVTYDDRLAVAAREFGLHVVQPGR